ncbi:MAG: hypothetical protein KME07_03425 [Pegethrix bostrychoides GSE-TBD4-15B]|uniref:Uncharacterized protein n=1 Tax=Pegethrix bostrychoides GSE-TBD4-15B TaxID=2839662 RepID=A0A951U3K8_9CYAN|nr:hypothetical protein [Pegethrix bostrychoides GSE-TBD4-15B]
MSNLYQPWVIIAIFPTHKPQEIARTRHRSDADAHARFLRRYVKQGEFQVMFDSDAAPTELPLRTFR